MAEKKITRKVISKAPVKEAKVSMEQSTAETEKPGSSRSNGDAGRNEAGRVKKVCSFCQSKTNPSYTDMAVLKRFVTDRAKIIARLRDGLCSKHQRFATRQIKYARHLALLPFTPNV